MNNLLHALGTFVLLKDFEDDFTLQEIWRALSQGIFGLVAFFLFYFTIFALADAARVSG